MTKIQREGLSSAERELIVTRTKLEVRTAVMRVSLAFNGAALIWILTH